jgi:hypothetical protein
VQNRYFNSEVNFFKEMNVFAQFKKSSLVKIIQGMTLKSLCKDSYLLKEEAPATTVYIVASGEVEVVKNIAEKRKYKLTQALDRLALHHKTDSINHNFKKPTGRKGSVVSMFIGSKYQVLGFEDAIAPWFDKPYLLKKK